MEIHNQTDECYHGVKNKKEALLLWPWLYISYIGLLLSE